MKRDNEPPSRAEEVALQCSQPVYRQTENRQEADTLFQYISMPVRDITKGTEEKKVRERILTIANFPWTCLEPYYRGANMISCWTRISNWFVVQTLHCLWNWCDKDHKILFPVVTIIIMEVFINKMRRLQGIRKMILIEEAWKAIAKEGYGRVH